MGLDVTPPLVDHQVRYLQGTDRKMVCVWETSNGAAILGLTLQQLNTQTALFISSASSGQPPLRLFSHLLGEPGISNVRRTQTVNLSLW